MGASLDTPAECPLCSLPTSELVTLKCKHRFCRRCIEALWSKSPDGPYECPLSRCESKYETLPFSPTSSLRQTRKAQRRNPAGTPNNEPSTSDSALGRPSLAGRLLGKRKASKPAAEQPETKRSTVEAPPEQNEDANSAKTDKTSPMKSSVHPANISPVIFNTHLASTSGPPDGFSSFPRAESASAGPVPCNYCPRTSYGPAVKTCLVCGASMCSEHLRPHLDSPVFQNHSLVPPTKDISSWRCLEHQEIKRIYCRQCAVCVCMVCTVIGSHCGHLCISIKEAEREL
ncbi:unnamed protein product, partial [Tetraodon nigroviridis]